MRVNDEQSHLVVSSLVGGGGGGKSRSRGRAPESSVRSLITMAGAGPLRTWPMPPPRAALARSHSSCISLAKLVLELDRLGPFVVQVEVSVSNDEMELRAAALCAA